VSDLFVEVNNLSVESDLKQESFRVYASVCLQGKELIAVGVSKNIAHADAGDEEACLQR
jgi:hypothetical protein